MKPVRVADSAEAHVFCGNGYAVPAVLEDRDIDDLGYFLR